MGRTAVPNATSFRPSPCCNACCSGFSLLESCLALLFVGLVLWLGIYSIEHMLRQGRVSRTQARLVQVKDCLVKRAVFNNRYPTYEAGNVDCDELSYDVNACICRGSVVAQDAWGRELHYVEGLDSRYAGLGGQRIQPLSASEPPVSLLHESRIIDEQSRYQPGVAFVLVSFGGDGLPDTPGLQLDLPAPLLADQPPDFGSDDGDDLYLAVTAAEIRGIMAQ